MKILSDVRLQAAVLSWVIKSQIVKINILVHPIGSNYSNLVPFIPAKRMYFVIKVKFIHNTERRLLLNDQQFVELNANEDVKVVCDGVNNLLTIRKRLQKLALVV